MLWLLVVICVAPSVLAQGDGGEKHEICFDNVGCFSMESPWYSVPARPVAYPQDPNKLNITFLFFNRENGNKSTVINVLPNTKLNGADVDGSKRTIIILQSIGGSGSWPYELKDALLSELDANVLITNTSKAFYGLNSFQHASNTRVIGSTIGIFLKYAMKHSDVKPEDVWIIGYGYGAQCAAYVKEYVKVGRITGLDPEQEFFEGFPPEVHLDFTDANFVDILHSDARPVIPDLGFGYIGTAGHIDFYLNGGHGQPGCKLPKPSDIATGVPYFEFLYQVTKLFVQSILCAHQRAFRVFIEAITIKNCTFWGHEGDKYNFLQAISNAGTEGVLSTYTALTTPCNMTSCVPLGIHTDETKLRGIFIVTTTGEKPYCIDDKTGKPEKEKNQQAMGLAKYVNGLIGGHKDDD